MFKWLEVVKLIVPVVVAAVNPALAPLGEVIANGISEAEAMPGASGADKLAHVTNIAVLSAQGANDVKGHQVIDPASMATAASAAISTAVQVANLIHAAQAPEAAAAPAPAK